MEAVPGRAQRVELGEHHALGGRVDHQRAVAAAAAAPGLRCPFEGAGGVGEHLLQAGDGASADAQPVGV